MLTNIVTSKDAMTDGRTDGRTELRLQQRCLTTRAKNEYLLTVAKQHNIITI